MKTLRKENVKSAEFFFGHHIILRMFLDKVFPLQQEFQNEEDYEPYRAHMIGKFKSIDGKEFNKRSEVLRALGTTNDRIERMIKQIEQYEKTS